MHVLRLNVQLYHIQSLFSLSSTHTRVKKTRTPDQMQPLQIFLRGRAVIESIKAVLSVSAEVRQQRR